MVEKDDSNSEPDNLSKAKVGQPMTHGKIIQPDDVDPCTWVIMGVDTRECPEIPYDDLKKVGIISYGSHATVYKANWGQSAFPVVVKQYAKPDDMSYDVRVFVRLGRHKNIVHFHGVTRYGFPIDS